MIIFKSNAISYDRWAYKKNRGLLPKIKTEKWKIRRIKIKIKKKERKERGENKTIREEKDKRKER